MGKRISNYDDLPEITRKVYDLVLREADGNVSSFADRIGVSQQVLERIFRKDRRTDKYPDVSKTSVKGALMNAFGLSELWFISGAGISGADTAVPVEDEAQPDLYMESGTGVKFYEHAGGGYTMSVRFVPYCSYGAFVNESDRLDPDRDEWEQETFHTDRIVHGSYYAFEVKGDSMDDGTRSSFEEGDRVLVRELGRQHWTDGIRFKDRPYWVVVFRSSVLIKQIVAQDLVEGTITLHSLNPSPEYADFKLHLDEVRALYYVLQKKPKAVKY